MSLGEDYSSSLICLCICYLINQPSILQIGMTLLRGRIHLCIYICICICIHLQTRRERMSRLVLHTHSSKKEKEMKLFFLHMNEKEHI